MPKCEKPPRKSELTPQEIQRNKDLRVLGDLIHSVAKEAEAIINEANDMADLKPVDEVEEASMPESNPYNSLLDDSHAANRGKKTKGMRRQKAVDNEAEGY